MNLVKILHGNLVPNKVIYSIYTPNNWKIYIGKKLKFGVQQSLNHEFEADLLIEIKIKPPLWTTQAATYIVYLEVIRKKTFQMLSEMRQRKRPNKRTCKQRKDGTDKQHPVCCQLSS